MTMCTATSPSPPPTIAIVSAGAMGAGVAARLSAAGCRVLTDLSGRSADSRRRAADAGMHDVPLSTIVREADWVLSILPPGSAYDFAVDFLQAVHASRNAAADASESGDPELRPRRPPPVFVYCNAKNPETTMRLARVFESLSTDGVPVFLNASIIGLPPAGTHDPAFYASAGPDAAAQRALKNFGTLTQYGLRVKLLVGEGVDADVCAASALKMAFSGIMKGMVGLYEIMILSAHAHSPATAAALQAEMRASLPGDLAFIDTYVPQSVGKAYRFVREMEEMAGFVRAHVDGVASPSSLPSSSSSPVSLKHNLKDENAGGDTDLQDGDGDGERILHSTGVGQIYDGFAAIFQRLADSASGAGRAHKDGSTDVEVLLNFVESARAPEEI